MSSTGFKQLLKYMTGVTVLAYICITSSYAQILSDDLSVISSADAESNSIQSFVIIPQGQLIQQGIKHKTQQQIIAQQTPFVVEYNKELSNNETLEWHIKVSAQRYGSIELLSNFNGNGQLLNSGYSWQSIALNDTIKDRHRLIFRPTPYPHQPTIYKKGRGHSGKRNNYGGGTQHIDDEKYNPQLSYSVTLNILKAGATTSSHKAILEMDMKDMIRQEYINHYDIKRYGSGENGNIPIPIRDEITQIPEQPTSLKGNPLTESEYDFIINDGMLDLAKLINKTYREYLEKVKADSAFYDLENKELFVPDLGLSVSSGWRNPERNEWYSNAVNGIHQRGGAVDLIITAPSGSRDAAIGYWVLWQALEKNKDNIDAYWQLETNGRPMTTKEFIQDIEPKNGIPDAFDRADHLHANINY